MRNSPETSPPSLDRLWARLEPHGQEHLLRFWDELDDAARCRLRDQLAAVDFPQITALHRQANAVHDWASLARRAEPAAALRIDHATFFP